MFITTIRRLSVLLVSGCIYMVPVDSPSSPAIVSISPSPAIPIFDIDAQFISPHFGPFLHIGNGTNTTHAAFTSDLPISISAFVTTDRPGLISAFDVDFSDLNIQTLEVVASAVFARAHDTQQHGGGGRFDGGRRCDAAVLGRVGCSSQFGSGRGGGQGGQVHYVGRSPLRHRIVIWVAGALLLGCCRKHRDFFTSWIAPFAEEADVWALGQFHSAALIFLVHAGICPLVSQILANAVLVACLLKGLFACFRYALPPPPPPPRCKKKKSWFN